MLELNKVYLGDCLEVMEQIDDKSIDMILCDLPYGTTEFKWDKTPPLQKLWEKYTRIIKPRGIIALTASQPFASKLIVSNIKLFRHELIWEKPNGTNFMNAKKMPLKNHESILIFGKGLGTYNPQFVQGKPYSVLTAERKSIQYRGKLRTPLISDGKRYPKSVIKFNTERGLHPTQKPVTLFEYLIKTYSNEGMTILDNCSGSGTTAVAAINTNRNYICIEKDENYYKLSIERINKHLQQNNLQPNA